MKNKIVVVSSLGKQNVYVKKTRVTDVTKVIVHLDSKPAFLSEAQTVCCKSFWWL